MKIQSVMTDLARGLFWQSETLAPAACSEANRICLYPEARFQTFEGFGGAFTEAAGSCYNRLSPADKAAFTAAVFGPDGLGYTLGRTHMQSCDFALSNYSCIEGPDPALETFSMERDEAYILPLLRDAARAAGRPISLLLSPWSPPAFMKSNGDMNHGGCLLPEYYEAWADCIVRYVKEYKAAGCDVKNISVQNEPAATQTWDSCVYSGEEEGRLAVILSKKLHEACLDDVGILVWDHNKDLLFRRAQASMRDAAAAKAVSGFAFHWYSGDHFDAVALTAQRWPDKKLYFTEGCVEYGRFGGASDLEKAEMYGHDILGNLSAGIHGSLDWNLLLDAKGGPNHVGNFCEAPLMLKEKDGEAAGFEKKGSYYYIGQFSRYIRPGAVRIGSSHANAAVETVAFQNTDGSVAAVMLNRSEAPVPVCLGSEAAACAPFTMAPHTIRTVIFSAL